MQHSKCCVGNPYRGFKSRRHRHKKTPARPNGNILVAGVFCVCTRPRPCFSSPARDRPFPTELPLKHRWDGALMQGTGSSGHPGPPRATPGRPWQPRAGTAYLPAETTHCYSRHHERQVHCGAIAFTERAHSTHWVRAGVSTRPPLAQANHREANTVSSTDANTDTSSVTDARALARTARTTHTARGVGTGKLCVRPSNVLGASRCRDQPLRL